MQTRSVLLGDTGIVNCSEDVAKTAIWQNQITDEQFRTNCVRNDGNNKNDVACDLFLSEIFSHRVFISTNFNQLHKFREFCKI